MDPIDKSIIREKTRQPGWTRITLLCVLAYEAAGGGTLTDNLHIAWAMVTILFMMVLMGFGAAALGKRFRLYTGISWAAFLVFGVLSGMESPGIEASLPTPQIGIWERINIGVFMLWVVVFAMTLMRRRTNYATTGAKNSD
jgi:hypothetical protein